MLIKIETETNIDTLNNIKESLLESIVQKAITRQNEVCVVVPDDLDQEVINEIIEEIKTPVSKFVLTQKMDFGIKNVDFRIYDIKTKTNYNAQMEIESKEYWYNDKLAIKEYFTYTYNQDNSIKEIAKTLEWYREDGRVGATKVLNRKYDEISSEEKTSEIRKEKIRKIKDIIAKQIVDPELYRANIRTLDKKMEDYIKYNDKDIIS